MATTGVGKKGAILHKNTLFVLAFLNTVSCRCLKSPQMKIKTSKEGKIYQVLPNGILFLELFGYTCCLGGLGKKREKKGDHRKGQRLQMERNAKESKGKEEKRMISDLFSHVNNNIWRIYDQSAVGASMFSLIYKVLGVLQIVLLPELILS
jgi:hypothetical protein